MGQKHIKMEDASAYSVGLAMMKMEEAIDELTWATLKYKIHS